MRTTPSTCSPSSFGIDSSRYPTERTSRTLTPSGSSRNSPALDALSATAASSTTAWKTSSRLTASATAAVIAISRWFRFSAATRAASIRLRSLMSETSAVKPSTAPS